MSQALKYSQKNYATDVSLQLHLLQDQTFATRRNCCINGCIAVFHLDPQGLGEIEMFSGEGVWGRSKGWGLGHNPSPI